MIHECFRMISKWLPHLEMRERLIKDPDLLKCIVFSLPFVSKFLVTKLIETFIDSCGEYEEFLKNYQNSIKEILQIPDNQQKATVDKALGRLLGAGEGEEFSEFDMKSDNYAIGNFSLVKNSFRDFRKYKDNQTLDIRFPRADHRQMHQIQHKGDKPQRLAANFAEGHQGP
jgi:hypothetical protein